MREAGCMGPFDVSLELRRAALAEAFRSRLSAPGSHKARRRSHGGRRLGASAGAAGKPPRSARVRRFTRLTDTPPPEPSGTLLRQGNLLEGGRRQLDQSLCTAALAASYGIKHRSQPGRWRPAPAARGGPSQDADLGRILGADRLLRDKLAGTQLSP